MTLTTHEAAAARDVGQLLVCAKPVPAILIVPTEIGAAVWLVSVTLQSPQNALLKLLVVPLGMFPKVNPVGDKETSLVCRM